MENIVFYVHRTGLLSYFLNPICSFLCQKYKIYIFHIDKRNGYSYASGSTHFFETIDISDKSINEINSILCELKPKAFVSLGFISIFELLMLRIAKQNGIKTIYLEHGLYSKETASLPFGKLIHNFFQTARKNLFFLRRYYQFAKSSGVFKYEMSVFWRCFRKKEYYLSKFDKAMFFAEYGREQIGKLFHYEDYEVEYINYPIAKTDVEFNVYSEIRNRPLTKEKKATYIHQPFILDGLAKWSYEEERNYLVKIANLLKEYGYSFSIQLHPRSDFSTYKRLFSETGIELQQGMERSDFKKYSLVVGHYSTALLYPIFFNIPVMLIDYPNVCSVDDSVFAPISCSLPIEEFCSLKDKYVEFCRKYIGSGICSFENIARKLTNTID